MPMSLFFLTVLLLSPHSSLASSTPPLLSFLDSLPPSSQLLLPLWNLTSPLCSWTGVSCSAGGDVVALNLSGVGLCVPLADAAPSLIRLPTLRSLDLSQNNLTGGIPSSLFLSLRLRRLNLDQNSLTGPIPNEISLATDLEHLSLYENYLAGEIPPELSRLPNLKYLYLNQNNLTGVIPDFPTHCSLSALYLHWNSLSGPLPQSLFNCHSLTELVLSFNHFVESVPDLFAEMPQLELLYLDDNGFVGELPRSLGKLRNLTSAMLSENHFNGSVPGEIGECRALESLSLWGNNLSGLIPSQIGKLTNLQSLTLAENQLVGPLPPELGNCSSLLDLELHDNLIEGQIPSSLTTLKNLKILWLFHNQLEGAIPPQIGNLSSLQDLQLYDNHLTGIMPSEITHLRKLQYLSLANNYLAGELPSDLGKSTDGGLIKLDLTENDFDGPIPAGLCSGNNLSVLVIGKNRFNGSFPVDIGRCRSLKRVILSYNHLEGVIPDNLHLNPEILYLDLSSNFFEGHIPQSITLWHNLTMLDMSNNSFSGPITPSFEKLSNLETLQLSSNRLTGTIPPQLANCTKLLRLDISQNIVSGSIPPEVAKLDKLQHLILSGNILTGQIPDSFTPSQNLLELHLGRNMLEGEIPSSIGNLQYISLALNLSCNRLTGEIPGRLSNLNKLQILDLSGNFLSGQIPSGLNNMVSLSFVNVSSNNLSGMLPSSWVKFESSSPESFFRNPSLCIQSDDRNYCSQMAKQRSKRTKFVVLFTILLSLTLLVAGLCAVRYFKMRSYYRSISLLAPSRQSDFAEVLPDDLTYEDIMRATEELSEKYVIGRGRYGTVYKTHIGMGKCCWAIKRIDLSEPSFSQEIRIMSLVRHRNLVRMAGYCVRDGFGMILYEYMQGGTLFELLHQKKPQVPLNWEVRHRIALGIAQGLSYLHHDCVPKVIHRDLKSSNILMDSELEPKVGDFGMAKLADGPSSDACSTVSSVVGTLGYIAPENGYSTRLNEKSDVFSYGVVLLELLSRKMSVDPSFEDGVDIVTWVNSSLQNAEKCSIFHLLDEEIWYWMENEKENALKLLELAILCTLSLSNSRPSMREVVRTLMQLEC
ncbi:Leucine-rich repeat receptor-like protein kinase PEPR1 [Platanthera zijinensis]|uniref:Leucine-rich repeat receptor-like protein kinase PEPR1 n=1 Tax=Platanthera zijinensis TaxID=2320716 RepID=A0AAP0BPN5_9ASPA